YTAMIQITAAIEGDILQSQFGSLAGDSSAYQLALLRLGDLLGSDVLITGRGRCQRLAIVIVDQLHIDVGVAPEHGQPGLLSRSADLLADAVSDLLSPECFRIHFYSFFDPDSYPLRPDRQDLISKIIYQQPYQLSCEPLLPHNGHLYPYKARVC